MKEFIEFLHRRGVLFAFAINGGFDNITQLDPDDFVDRAFYWFRTHQGEDLWVNVELAWWREIGYY